MSAFIIGMAFSELSNSNARENLRIRVFLKVTLALVIGGLVWQPQTTSKINSWYLSNSFVPTSDSWIFYVFNGRAIPDWQRMTDLSYLLIASAVVLITELSSTLRDFFCSKPLQLLGKASFGLYTIHWCMLLFYFSCTCIFLDVSFYLCRSDGFRIWRWIQERCIGVFRNFSCRYADYLSVYSHRWSIQHFVWQESANKNSYWPRTTGRRVDEDKDQKNSIFTRNITFPITTQVDALKKILLLG